MVNINEYLKRFQAFICKALFPSLSNQKLGIGFLCIGLCIGVIVRVGMLWFVDYKFYTGDSLSYLNAAHNFINFHIYAEDPIPVPSFYRPPLYSFFVALVMGVFGNNPLFVQLTQLVISIITALLITRITACYVPKAAPWVFGLMMLSPYEAVYTGAVLSETITAFLLVTAAYAILTIEGLKRWAIGGVLLGLCVLTRDIYLYFIILVAVSWIVIGSGRKRLRCFEAAVFVLSACLVVLPWTLRNYSIAERLIPISEGRLGVCLWIATWDINGSYAEAQIGQRDYPPEAFRSGAEKDLLTNLLSQGSNKYDKVFLEVAIRRILDEPADVLRTYIVRAPRLWFATRFDIFQLNAKWFPRGSHSWVVAKSILWGINASLILLGIIGMVLAWRQRNLIVGLTLPILYTAIIYFPLTSYENRYSQPVYPFVIVFAGIAVVSIADKFTLILQKRNDGLVKGA
jgi:4-amino-4-deoxy-L-arabinose transferase-like glycosyltransferase